MKKINLIKVLAFSSLLLVGCNSTTTTSSKSSGSNGSGDLCYDFTYEPADRPANPQHAEGDLVRYTESWRSVKTEGWGITKAVERDPKKLEAALKLFDYMYSDAGNELMSYGPSEYGYLAMEGDEVKTIDYQGKKVPELSQGTLAQLADPKLGNNNYTNYYRYFVGATLPIGYVKEQGMEYQCTHEGGKEGLARINKNIEVGTFEHPYAGGNADSENVDVSPMDQRTTLNLSILYQQNDSEPKFTPAGKIGNDGYLDPKGNKYSVGDWKPTWKALQERLNLSFTNATAGNNVDNNYTAYKAQGFGNIDIITGKASSFAVDGPTSFVNLMCYLDRMPNFLNFLVNHPIVLKTVTSLGDNNQDAIYYAPYFDGYDDIERMTLLREDWLVKLLDGTDTNFDTDTTLETHYTAKIAKKDYTVKVAASLDNTETKEIKKNQSTKNIIEIQNALEVKNGETLTKALLQYIKDVYGEQYKKPSDLFMGVDAAYDADEFIALLRCVKTNPVLLSGDKTKEIIPFYPRAVSNDRLSDIFRWGAHLWGVQGVESRSGFLFIDNEDERTVKDARGQLSTAQMLDNLHQIYDEGLILKNFTDKTATGGTSGNFNTDLGTANKGFATYDYCQTQTALNTYGYANNEFKLIPVIGAFTNWGNKLQYVLTPTTFKLTSETNDSLTTDYVDLNTITVEKGKTNLWTKYVIAGFGGTYEATHETLCATPEEYVELMKQYKVQDLEQIYSSAYQVMY